jgi:ribulose-phosphate 3-epimerase
MMPIQRLVPAILTDNKYHLEQMVRIAAGWASWIQFDIMDGAFVPSRSISVDDIASVRPVFAWEVHLMVDKPRDYIESCRRAGARRVIFHFEAVKDPLPEIDFIHHLGMEAGLAINPDTSISVIDDVLADAIDLLLFMSVYPGYYGRPFIPQTLPRIKEMHTRYPDLTIGIDGGIKAGNIREAALAGADEICVGSAVFGTGDAVASYRQLLEMAHAGWMAREHQS